MFNYQAIVFDIDGTAVPNRSNGRPSARLKAAINARRDNYRFIAATGRPLSRAIPVIEDLGLTDLCVVAGGPIIYDPTTRQIIRTTNISPESLHAVLHILRPRTAFGVHIHERQINLAEQYNPEGEVEHIVVDHVSIADAPTLLAELNSVPGIAATSVPSWHGDFYAIMITHQDATKKQAIAGVLDELGIDPATTIGIGDGANDLHLFDSVGLKVAMGNADALLKAEADLIAPSQDEDGMAQIIERYFSAIAV